MIHEAAYWEKKIFLTLTYDDLWLPQGNTLVKRDLQLFWKLIRKRIKEEDKDRVLRYYACGEYGDIKGRAHYHAVVYGLDFDDYLLIHKTWGKGIIHIGTVTDQSCRYVSGYVMKKYNGKKAKEVYGNKQPPFQCCSLGIGKRYVEKNKDLLVERLYFTVNGRKRGLPRYYYKKLKDFGLEEMLKDSQNRITLERMEESPLSAEQTPLEYMAEVKRMQINEKGMRKQREEALKTREEMIPKGKL